MDLVWIVGGTVLFWKLVGKPVSDWFEGYRGVRIVGRVHTSALPPEPRDERGHPEQILERDIQHPGDEHA
jgi:hypothetical protein